MAATPEGSGKEEVPLGDRALWAALLVASAAVVASLWSVDYLPTNDGPQHLLAAHIEGHYEEPGTLYRDLLKLEPQFAGRGFSMLFLPLQALLPWKAALRVVLSIGALLWGWGCAALMRAVDPQERVLVLASMLVPLRWSLYMGFFPFYLASGFGWVILALALRSKPTSRLRWPGLSLMLLLQSIMHVFAAMLTWPMVVLLSAARAEPEHRLREARWALVSGLPAFGIFALTYVTRSTLLTVRFSEATTWMPLADRPAAFLSWLAPGPLWRGVIVLALLVFCWVSALRRARSRVLDVRLALVGASLVFCAAALLAPIHIKGWQYFSPRFVDGALVFGLAAGALPDSLRSTRAAGAAAVALSLGSAGVSAHAHRALRRACADALSGLDRPIHRTGMVLPLSLSGSCNGGHPPPPVPELQPLLHVHALYAMAHGGMTPYLAMGTASVHAIGPRKDEWAKTPIAPDPEYWAVVESESFAADPVFRRKVLTRLAAHGFAFEALLVFGARQEDVQLLERLGFAPEWSQGELFIGAFRSCQSQLLLPAREAGSPALVVSYGLVPVDEPLDQMRFDGGRGVAGPDAPPTLSVPLTAGLCGEVWVRAFSDADGSGSFTPGDRTCRGADASGRIAAELTRERPLVECALE